MSKSSKQGWTNLPAYAGKTAIEIYDQVVRVPFHDHPKNCFGVFGGPPYERIWWYHPNKELTSTNMAKWFGATSFHLLRWQLAVPDKKELHKYSNASDLVKWNLIWKHVLGRLGITDGYQHDNFSWLNNKHTAAAWCWRFVEPEVLDTCPQVKDEKRVCYHLFSSLKEPQLVRARRERDTVISPPPVMPGLFKKELEAGREAQAQILEAFAA